MAKNATIPDAEPGQDPSPDIRDLKHNPRAFLEKDPVASNITGPFPSQQPAWVKLVRSVPWNNAPRRVYNVQFSDTPYDLSVAAYILQYNSKMLQQNNPLFVDIPVVNPAAGFLFTGELSGCSLVVTDRGDNNYRVYHDSRYNSSVLHSNVVMAVDYSDYDQAYDDETPRNAENIATACMHYEPNNWKLYAQCLNVNSPKESSGLWDFKRVLRWKGPSPVIAKDRATGYTAPTIEQDRNNLYNYLLETAQKHLPADKLPKGKDLLDGKDFEKFDPKAGPSLENPFVRRTVALRKAISEANLLNILADKMKKNEIKEQEFRIYKKKFSDSLSTDATYLWLQLKRTGGTVVLHP